MRGVGCELNRKRYDGARVRVENDAAEESACLGFGCGEEAETARVAVATTSTVSTLPNTITIAATTTATHTAVPTMVSRRDATLGRSKDSIHELAERRQP